MVGARPYDPVMGPVVEQLVYLLDESFDHNEEHSLVANLRAVAPAQWWTPPPDGARSVAAIVGHCGWFYYVYDDYAFGRASLRDPNHLLSPAALREPGEGHIDSLLEWLAAGFTRFRASVAALDDGDLLRPRPVHWGAAAETRWIIAQVCEHGLYHAGEINHIRALMSRDDRWPGEP